MRLMQALAVSAAMGVAAAASPALAEDFDACTVFTQEDAAKALATQAAGEPVNPKARRPRVVTTCTYNGFKEGKPVTASAQFRFARTDADSARAFDDARLQFQTKPMLISGAEAFWSAKTGQMNLRKGRTWVVLSVGGPRPADRDIDPARRLAEILVAKL